MWLSPKRKYCCEMIYGCTRSWCVRVRVWVKTEGHDVGVRFYKINGRSVNTIWHQYRYVIMHFSIFIVRSPHGVFPKLRYVIYIFAVKFLSKLLLWLYRLHLFSLSLNFVNSCVCKMNTGEMHFIKCCLFNLFCN